MGVAFSSPLALLLLPAALAVTLVLRAAGGRRLGVARRRAALLVRSVLLACLVGALAGFQLVLPVDRLATIFVVDLSDSVGNAGRQDGLAFVRQSLAAMPQGDVAGIVAFGGDALVERLPGDGREVDRLASIPVRSATDVGAALRLAAALFPDDAQRRIVLLSDGNDTTGHAEAEAALAAARGIQVETRTIGRGASDEVLVERLQTPPIAHVGEDIEAVATVSSTVAQPATIRLYADGTLVATQHVQLPAGTLPVTFQVIAGEAGFHVFRAVVEAARDTFSQNDRADSDTIVQGEPRVLVVAADEAVAGPLVGALRTERQRLDLVAPEELPDDLAALAAYDSVVLVDVPRSRLTDRQQTALQTDVRDLGRGLVMVGGPHTFAAGGYRDSPLEEALPVEMGVRDRTKRPDVALVVVIDKSGSMDACHCNSANRNTAIQVQGVRKTDIGKEAILRAAAAMDATDQLGVVAFDQAAHWVVKTEALGSIADLQADLGAIQPNGQTNIAAGLDQAVASLEQSTVTRKHIILLTDGWSTSGQYDAILARMKAAGITLSTIGAGGGAAPLLAQLAQKGGGRFYDAVDPASIPDVFLKETQQVSGQQIVEEPFHPVLTGTSPILRGIAGGYPQLLGYDGTTAKAAAQVPLVTARDDPLLAQWQYGLGRAVAWTSDASGRWAKAWVGWDRFSRFFSQLVGWTFPGEESGGIEASFEPVGDGSALRVQSVAADGSPRDFYDTSAMVVGPDLRSVKVDLSQTAPGVYEAPVGSLEPGAYAVRITQTRAGAAALGRTLGLVAPTAAEYRLLGTDDAFLAAVRGATGGGVAASPAAVWRHDLAATSSFTDLWPLLLVLAMLLWPLDVALRRVSIGRRELAAARAWPGSVVAGWRARRVAQRGTREASLLAARSRAGGAGARAALLQTPDPTAATAPEALPIQRPRTATEPPVDAVAGSPAATASPVSDTTAPSSARTPAVPEDALARLREAKRRARDRG
ncbi:MAG TPA: VWA domain-containing protein [Candidatus Limnocylindrales bacterium]